MEMGALHAPRGPAVVEQIHQPGFAATDAAPEVQPLDVRRLVLTPGKESEQVTRSRLPLQPVPQLVQRFSRGELVRIGAEAAAVDQLPVAAQGGEGQSANEP
jgi:hypothetical protein